MSISSNIMVYLHKNTSKMNVSLKTLIKYSINPRKENTLMEIVSKISFEKKKMHGTF